MHNPYDDIRSRLGKPLWFDENAVPRYCPFTPDEFADIYARQGCLMEIACQNCGQRFEVAMSSGSLDRYDLVALVQAGAIYYGDPPNVNCCSSGPTMTSISLRMLEFWIRNRDTHRWERKKRFEGKIEDDVYAGRKEERC